MNGSLNQFYHAVGVSKQRLHQYLNRELERQSYIAPLINLIYQVRDDHPTMGMRDMYFFIEPEKIGRDAFERICKQYNLQVKRPINYQKTTDSSGVIRFPNLTKNLEINGINQVWVSDITYYRVGNRFYYLTFVMDAYSRRILGHSASRRLFTDHTTLPCLQMAIKQRKGVDLTGLILHSDGGGQYYADDFLAFTKKAKIQNSMCCYPWENGKAERINGVIKNNYLAHRNITTFEELTRELDRAVSLYNSEKPHIELNRVSPITYELYYLCSGKKADGEKSTKESKSHKPKGLTALRAVGKKPQAQISL